MENFKRELVQAIYKELEYKDHIKKVNNDAYYYENAYVEPIRKIYKEKGFRDNELKVNKYGLIRACSIASSFRLCFLYFRDKIMSDAIESEKPRYNDVNENAPSCFDAYSFEDNVYYELKCQEITVSKGLLSKSYLNSKFFKEFGVDKDKIDINQKYNIQFNISELGIIGIKDVPYNKLKFDLKQLICHLIALANDAGNKDDGNAKTKTLQYLFFIPSKTTMEKNEVLKKLYDELKQEIKAIWNSNKIKNFCDKYDIKLAYPEFIEINSIKDKVYSEVKWESSVQ